MTTRKVLAIAGLAVLLPASYPEKVLGTTGGPHLVEILGYEARESRVYFKQVWYDECGDCGGVWYFDLSRSDAETPIRVPTMDPRGDEPWEAHDARVEALRARLTPLSPFPYLGLNLDTELLSQDTLEAFYCQKRFHVRATLSLTWAASPVMLPPANYRPWSGELTTLEEPRVALAGTYLVRGPKGVIALIAILAYRGSPVEMCYEVQRAVLLQFTGRTTK